MSVAVSPEVAQHVQNVTPRYTKGLLIWTIYKHPRDFPNLYIARAHLTEPGQTEPFNFHLEAQTLDALRAMLPVGLVMVTRMDADEPQIVETWL